MQVMVQKTHHKTKAIFLAEKKGGVLINEDDCHSFN